MEWLLKSNKQYSMKKIEIERYDRLDQTEH